MKKTVWWTKSNFLGLLPECSKDQWDCDIVNYYIAHILLKSDDAYGRRRKIVLQFGIRLNKRSLRCGDNFHSTVLVMKAFQHPIFKRERI